MPWIPQEREIDDLIAGCGAQMAVALQVMKETAARLLEVWSLEWEDIDFERKTIRVTARKGGSSHLARVIERLLGMLNKLPRTSDQVFSYASPFYMSKTFRKQRQRVAANWRIRGFLRFTSIRLDIGEQRWNITGHMTYSM